VCFASFSGILVHLSGAGAFTAAFFRAFYAIPPLLVLAAVFGGPDRRTPRTRLLAVVAGLLLGVDLAAFHGAIGAIGAGPASVLAQTQVVFVGVLAWVIDGERPRRTVVVAVPVAAVGIVLLAGAGDVASAFGDNPGRGVLLGLLSGLSFAAFLVVLRAASPPGADPIGPLLDATAGAAVASLAFGLLTGNLDPDVGLTGHGWLILLALGIQVTAWLGFTYVLPRLPALDLSAIILLHPIISMIWAWWILDETLSGAQLTGAALVVVAVTLVGSRPRAEPLDVQTQTMG
jgi:drug/metabolite transporter (DMT)-like permease